MDPYVYVEVFRFLACCMTVGAVLGALIALRREPSCRVR